jgi:hypothetical protein
LITLILHCSRVYDIIRTQLASLPIVLVAVVLASLPIVLVAVVACEVKPENIIELGIRYISGRPTQFSVHMVLVNRLKRV